MNLSLAAHEAIEKGNQLDVFYGDFKNAFDKVCHRLLLQKLPAFGIGKMTCTWIKSYLIQRSKYVTIKDCKSRRYVSTSGIPAGSTLGPLLFLLFINDVNAAIDHSTVLLFADDIKMFIEVSSSIHTLRFQNDINKLLQWCDENKQQFNIEKCAVETIGRSRDFTNALYTMNQHNIERKTEKRDLGVLIDQRFYFRSHIEQITARARQMIGYIKKISQTTFTQTTIKILYSAYVRPILEFSVVVWDPWQGNYIDDIESVQKSFILFLLGDSARRPPYRLKPYEERCKLAGIDTLQNRRKKTLMLFAFEIYKNYIKDERISQKFIIAQSTRNLRSNRLLVEPFFRTESLYQQPIAKMIRLVNRYKDIYQNVQFKEQFKTKLKQIVQM